MLFFRKVKGWRLSHTYDLNLVPINIRPRGLSTAITPNDPSASLDLALKHAAYFGLRGNEPRQIAAEVADVVSSWRDVAKELRLSARDVERMASAFEHDDLRHAVRFGRRAQT